MVKKLVALGAGLTMLGATVMGAMAADLSNYPNQFITDEGFEGAIVVGTNSASIDTVGSTSIVLGLQRECGGGGTEGVTVSEGVKIEKTGDALNFLDAIQNIQDTPLDDTDLPNILAEETYDDSKGENDNEEEYTQELLVGNGTVVWEQDDDGDEIAGAYLKIDNNELIYTYTLEFDDEVDIDNSSSSNAAEDLENTKLTILDQVYTIVDAKMTGASNTIKELELQAGDTTVWLQQAVPITRVIDGASHEIELINVDEDENRCGINVDGKTEWVDKGKTATVGGIEVGVTDAIAVHSDTKDTDVCEVNIGAEEIKLKDGKKVESSGVDIDDTEVNFNQAGGEWSGFNITWQADDDIYLGEEANDGDVLTDPVFGAFMIKMAGMTYDSAETIELKGSGENLELTFENQDGKTVEVPFVLNETLNTSILGDGNDVDEQLLIEGDTIDCGTSVEDCNGIKLFMVDSGENAHILELSIDADNNETDIDDLTYDRSYTDKDYTPDAISDIDLGSTGSIQLNISEANNEITAETLQLDGAAETINEAVITFNDNIVNITENDDEGVEQIITINITEADDDDDILGMAVDFDGVAGTDYYDFVDESDANDDVEYAATAWGSIIERDADDENTNVVITHPASQAYANVFVAPTGAVITTTGAGADCVVPDAILAEEAGELYSKNMILVGGPCANELAAEFKGNPEDCTEGYEEGMGLIEIAEDGGKVAILVAGYNGEDTRRASKVLQNYADYALSGTSAEVTGTSLTDIQVSTVE